MFSKIIIKIKKKQERKNKKRIGNRRIVNFYNAKLKQFIWNKIEIVSYT